jgi:ABC-type Fe3+-siderophore transport system permease subunit
MAATAILTWLHRQVLVLPAFTTGILLLCDAWFDVTTASPAELRASVLTALLGGVPLACVLIVGALSLVRLNARRLWLLEPGQSLWRLPLLP